MGIPYYSHYASADTVDIPYYSLISSADDTYDVRFST